MPEPIRFGDPHPVDDLAGILGLNVVVIVDEGGRRTARVHLVRDGGTHIRYDRLLPRTALGTEQS